MHLYDAVRNFLHPIADNPDRNINDIKLKQNIRCVCPGPLRGSYDGVDNTLLYE